MKKNIILICLFLSSYLGFATVYTVSNDPGNPAQYSTLTAAVSAASSGDTIYIQGSVISYASTVDIDKKLTIIGPGKSPVGNKHLRATFRSIRFLAGSDGSSLYGVYFTDGCLMNDNNIIVSGCQGGSINVTAANCIIRDNYLVSSGNVNPYAVYSIGTAPTNLLIEHNIIYSQFYKISGATIRNNIFTRGIDLFKSSNNNTLENNIFYGSYVRNCGSCTFNNNITYGNANDSLPLIYTGSSNIISQNPLFENAPLSYTPHNERFYDWTLKSSSPAKGVGSDSKDLGIYGGSNPATLSGNGDIPLISKFEVENAIVPAGGKVKIKITSTKPE